MIAFVPPGDDCQHEEHESHLEDFGDEHGVPLSEIELPLEAKRRMKWQKPKTPANKK